MKRMKPVVHGCGCPGPLTVLQSDNCSAESVDKHVAVREAVGGITRLLNAYHESAVGLARSFDPSQPALRHCPVGNRQRCANRKRRTVLGCGLW